MIELIHCPLISLAISAFVFGMVPLQKLALVTDSRTVAPKPSDPIWCAEPRPNTNDYQNGDADPILRSDVEALAARCESKGHAPTRNLLEPYRVQMETSPLFDLTRIYGYAPQEVLRKNNTNAGDSALGNLTAYSIMIRKRVEAEFALTNTLGIRDNFYSGVIDQETVFNVMPFENTITIMYLSGREVQEVFDFVAERSTSRGCQSQAQIAGASFVMNCGQVKRNKDNHPCQNAEDCCVLRPEICGGETSGSARWECRLGFCYSHPAEDIQIGGRAMIPDASYKLATNDYVAAGGSGFVMLRRNTTKINTGIVLRDALTEHLRGLLSCREILLREPDSVDPLSLAYCVGIQTPAEQRGILVKGTCSCGDLLDGNRARCGSFSSSLFQFCRNPLDFPLIVGRSDGRITLKLN